MNRNSLTILNVIAFPFHKQLSLICFFFWIPLQSVAASLQQEKLPGVATDDVINWTGGLFLVLALFFICMFLMRKINRFSVTGAGKLSVLGGLSLGMREKIILVQVGNKQLVLGVTPGRIDALHILEGEECLQNEQQVPSMKTNQFAEKLQQVMKGSISG